MQQSCLRHGVAMKVLYVKPILDHFLLHIWLLKEKWRFTW